MFDRSNDGPSEPLMTNLKIFLSIGWTVYIAESLENDNKRRTVYANYYSTAPAQQGGELRNLRENVARFWSVRCIFDRVSCILVDPGKI